MFQEYYDVYVLDRNYNESNVLVQKLLKPHHGGDTKNRLQTLYLQDRIGMDCDRCV